MTPTISVPLDTLMNLAVLLKTDGENSKAKASEIVKGIMEDGLKQLEREAVFK